MRVSIVVAVSEPCFAQELPKLPLQGTRETKTCDEHGSVSVPISMNKPETLTELQTRCNVFQPPQGRGWLSKKAQSSHLTAAGLVDWRNDDAIKSFALHLAHKGYLTLAHWRPADPVLKPALRYAGCQREIEQYAISGTARGFAELLSNRNGGMPTEEGREREVGQQARKAVWAVKSSPAWRTPRLQAGLLG